MEKDEKENKKNESLIHVQITLKFEWNFFSPYIV